MNHLSSQRIYLDNNATTAIDKTVLDAVLENLSLLSNPSSIHYFGKEARKELNQARETIADFFNISLKEVIFTSGGTECMNMLLRGLFLPEERAHIISSNVEHSCVFNTLQFLEKQGHEVTYLPAGLHGAVEAKDVKKSLRSTTRLITLIAVNNETGVKTDLEAISEVALEARIPFISDGVALLGKELFSIPKGLSAMGFSGHKLHGPKGIGFAFIRSGLKLAPLILGGDQEYGKRGGTENLPAIIGLAKAIECLKKELPLVSVKMQLLRDRLETGLIQAASPIIIHGLGPRIANTSNIAFPDIDGEALLMNLDLAGIAVSHGSACSSGSLEPSRILLNMGVSTKQARTALRFSLSRFNTEEEIDITIKIVSDIVKRLRGI